jgi:hypothetical protein
MKEARMGQHQNDGDDGKIDSRSPAADGRNTHLRHVMVWAIRNWARGVAGQINLRRELDTALSPAAAQIAYSAIHAIMLILTARGERPFLVRPVPCRHLSVDERRMALLCAALLAGHEDCAQCAAAELVSPDTVPKLVEYVQLVAIAILDGNLPIRLRPTPHATPPLTIH